MSGGTAARGFRLSPQQRHLWHLGADSPAYRAQCALVLPAAAGVTLPRRALERVVARHEILRTTFSRSGLSVPLQMVGTDAAFVWREAGPVEDGGLDALLSAERQAPFDLAAGPLLHAALAALPDGRRLLVLTLPALCADPRSLRNLAAEVVGLCGGSEAALAPDSVQYAKYAEWQNGLLEDEDSAEGRAYWSSLGIAGSPSPLPPFTAPAGGAFEPRSLRIELPPGLADRLDELAGPAETSCADLLLALWQALLFRVTGQPDFAVGVTCDGREYDILAGAVGLISRDIPLPAHLDPALTLGELARSSGARLAAGREWQDVCEGLPGEDSALFSYEEEAAGDPALLAISFCGSRFLLRLGIVRRGGDLAAELGYDPSRLSEEAAARLAGSLVQLLTRALASPQTPLGDLDVLGEGERRQTVVDWNRTARRFAGAECLHELFAEQARRFPDRLAVVCGGSEMTYSELHARSNQLARWLVRAGAGPGARIALLLDRSLEMVTAILGTLKAGAGYVPIDPGLPAERVDFLIASASVEAVVTRQSLVSTLPASPVRRLLLDGEEGVARESADDLPPLATGSDLAYVLFTSGSTGTPKGVEVEHRQIVNYVKAISEVLDLPGGSGFAMVSTFAADLGNTVLFPALCGGGRLYIATEERASDPELLAADFERIGVDCLKIVPSHLSALLNTFRPERLLPRALLVLGGEALSWELAETVGRHAPGCRILNHYGPTETTVGVLTFAVEAGRRVLHAAGVPLGRPLANVQIYLADEALRLVPAGLPGEILVGGASLARGYLEAPDLTAERFIPDPFGGGAGARLYHTGDRARRLPDGSIEFLGRVDQQVKIRGFRVEPGEVEAVLRSHPAVRDAVVTVRADVASGPLVAYVVAPAAGTAAGGERTFPLPNGIEVFHLNKNETLHLYRQIFEDRIYLRHGIEIEDGSCVFDVGANIGLFSLFVHQVCRAPRIYAFEPSPVTFETLRRNVDLHRLGVRLHQAGVAASRGTAMFTFYPRVSVMSGFHADATEEESLFRGYLSAQEHERVPGADLLLGAADELVAGRFEKQEYLCELTTISDAIREHGIEQIDLLKIDVEKSELEVLSGIAADDWPRIRQLTVEVHDVDGRPQRIADLLAGHGFTVSLEQDDTLGGTGIFHVFASRPRNRAAAWVPRSAASPLPTAAPLTAEDLREFLRRRLPEQMIPGCVVFLPQLPLTRNGKVDRAALPDPEATAVERRETVAPRTREERLLAAVWCEVLGVPEVGIHDNFFELGGDSILAIQVTARASRAGLRLATRDLFRHQTVAELSAVAVEPGPAAAGPAPVSGPVPLTPIQHWFFAQELPDPGYFNQAVLLALRSRVEPGLLAEALRALLAHHDALRLRFTRTAAGWLQESVPPGGEVPLHLFDLAAVPESERSACLEPLCEELQASLDPGEGRLVRAALFDLGGEGGGRLLIAIHHLAVDGVSWRILLEDLEQALGDLQRGRPVELPPRTTSFQSWAQRLNELAGSGGFDGELAGWLAQTPGPVAPLPRDGHGANTVAAARTLELSLAPEETAALLHDVPRVSRTRVDEILLTALALACREWTGSGTLLVDLEGHGREEILAGVDLSRTVGWFTTHFPLCVDLSGVSSTSEALRQVKAGMRGIPHRGLGYGVLRYLGPNGATLAARPQPELKLNYLGQLDQILADSALLAPAPEPAGRMRGARGERSHLLELDALVREHRLHLTFTYPAEILRAATVERLGQSFIAALRSVIDHCLAARAEGFVPADFPLVQLGQNELDAALRETGFAAIEDVYPLSPTQEGMLFHTLHSPGHGVYVTQYTCVLHDLDLPRFLAAWQRVIDRHPALRTAFAWQSTERPVQIVGLSVSLPLEERDWSALAEEERERELEAYLAADRARGFKPDRAPLTRLGVMRLGAGASRLVWSFHHLILDGWCRAIVLAEVLAAYAALAGGGEPRFERARPYRDYIGWLQRQDLSRAEACWREVLRGFSAPTPLGVDRPAAGEAESHASRFTLLTQGTTEALQGFARRNRLTVSSVVQGAWSLLLGRYSGEPEVVYGTVVSGRPPEIEGVESIVGMFINTLPVRVGMSDGPLVPWLEELQSRQAEMRHYEYSPLVQVQKWSEVPQGTPLFESIFAFENFPQESDFMAGLRIEDVRSVQRGNYPLAGAAAPGERMHLRLFYGCNRFDMATIDRALGHFQSLLEGMAAASPAARLADLPLLTAVEHRQALHEWNGGGVEWARDACFHDLFAAAAARTPEAPAVVAGGERLTYRELDERSGRLGRHLLRLGVAPGARVGLLLERSAAAVVSVLAVWKSGGAYVPLPVGLPAERLAFILGDAGISVLLTDEASSAALPQTSARVVRLDMEPGEDEDAAVAGPWPRVPPESLAYVIYTSGSTGRPKGVGVEHRQLVHYLAAVRERLELPAHATFATISPLSVDLGHTTFFTPLWTGGCLHLLSSEEAGDGDAMGDYFVRHPIDCLKIVPTHLSALLGCRRPERLLPRRCLILGGEAADARLVRRLRELAPGCTLLNHYGPTETTVGITTHRAEESDPDGALPLGRPLGESRIHFVGVHGQLVPAGVMAELCAGGPGLARGYLGRPDLTAERFIPDAFGTVPGGRLYRTGDLARRRPDGVIEFLGRRDHQVKIRGFRVEPQEAEAVLAAHPGLSGAVVTTWQDPSGARQLVAYAVPRHRSERLAGRPLELPSGLMVYHLNKNETEHLYRQIFESQIYLRHGIGLAEGACIFDVGANIGMFALFAHHVCERLRVFAFEPSPPAFERLAANAEHYRLDVRLFPCALSNREGTAELTIYPRASVMSGLYADAAEEEELFRDYMAAQEQEGTAQAAELLRHVDELAAGRFDKQTVPCPLRTISSVIREHRIERIDLLKVDAEKSEMDIFEGIEPQHWAIIEQVTAEVHDIDGRVERAAELLRSHGFEVAGEQDSSLHDTGIHHLYAFRPRAAAGDARRDRPWRVPVPAAPAEPVGADELRGFLASRLPDYMVPQRIVLLDRLPLLPNGKIDRAALPDPEAGPRPAAAEETYVAPRTPAEQRLAEIWSEVLGVERVGVHDNFFQLGGDSILNIQIVARAHRAGLRLSPSQLFKHPTVAELAAEARPVTAPGSGSGGPVSGAVPLTPIQEWFFERDLADPHHFAMPVLLALREAIHPSVLERALAALLEHHDALRLGFRRGATGWEQWNAPPGGTRPALVVCDLSSLPAELAGPALAVAGESLQAGFDLGRPPLVSAGLFRRGGAEPDLLLLAVHHLVVDGVSWRILLEDFATACDQLRRGQAVTLPPRTTSFKEWSERLRKYVLEGGLAAEAAHWLALQGIPPELPVDFAGRDDTAGSARAISGALSRAETESLLYDLPPVYGTEIQEALLAALARVLAGWTAREAVLIDLEGHGREELFAGVDLSRTVGWLTTHYPVLLSLPEPGSPGADLLAVKEQLRAVPSRGIGYGALRYLSGDEELRASLRTLPQPQVKLNYLGQLDQALSAQASMTPLRETAGAARSPRGARAHRLEVAGGVSDGCLWIRWSYNPAEHREETVRELSDGFLAAIRALLDHCRSPEAGSYTPSDFPDAGLNQEALDSLLLQMGGNEA